MLAVMGDMEQEAALIRDAMDLVKKLGTMVLSSIVAILPVLTLTLAQCNIGKANAAICIQMLVGSMPRIPPAGIVMRWWKS